MQNKTIISLVAAVLLAGACMSLGEPYSEGLNSFSVSAIFPEGVLEKAGATVTVESLSGGISYSLKTDASGTASTQLPDDIYRVRISHREGEWVYNGTKDRVVVASGQASLSVEMLRSRAGTLVIKEIYCGGCPKDPEEGTYQSDQYLILHNNDILPQYLDGLCLGTLSPYNSNSANPWVADGALPEFLPIIQAVWEIGGSGTSFPLGPGEDAVICLRGAIDHSRQYPLSVNLNRPGYFVCYNNVYFPNPTYHPVPGDQITQDHWLQVVIKTGQANAYTVSVNSPALVIFRPQGVDIQDFVAQPQNLLQVPGSSVDRVVAVPEDWVIDGVEVFNGGSSDNRKRLGATVDAGYVILSESFKGHTLMRYEDADASALQGITVLKDTNNSTEDFYERTSPSLRD